MCEMTKIIDLDVGEDIDYITINGRPYEVGTIPKKILDKVNDIDISKGFQYVLDQWRGLCKEILEVRNDGVNMDHITDQKLTAFIKYVLDKIRLPQWYAK